MSTYEISKSSLLSLKAEILRKQQELTKTKTENDVKIRNIKKTAPLEIKNKGLEQRRRFDITEEEENLLKKSRSALEAKAKLYDRLSKGTSGLTEEEIDYNRRYLVRFDSKSRGNISPPEFDENDVDKYPESEEEEDIGPTYEAPTNPEEEFVEYVDCLGRTRMCLRKDLDYLKSKDKDLEVIVEEKRRNKDSTADPPPLPPRPKTPEPKTDSDLMSSDMRREILRRQWEKEEDALRDKSDIHYQDILFDEARTHGVGYYGFSKDEEQRAKQQEELRKLREETKEQQKRAQDLKSTREKQLKARIQAAKNRRRERLGLPPAEEKDEEPEVEQVKIAEEEKPQEKQDEEQERLEQLRKNHVRPWDRHKKQEHYEYSQEEWVDKRRRERQSEFAPPTTYKREFHTSEKREYHETNKTLSFSTKKSKREPVNPYKPTLIVNELSSSDSDEGSSRRGCQVPPPATYDHDKRATRAPPGGSINESIEAGLRYLREQQERQSKRRRDSLD